MNNTLSFLLISVLLVSSLQADSLFDNARTPFYGGARRTIDVGHVVTVYVSEATSAVQQASTSTERESSLAAVIDSSWEQISDILGNETIEQSREYALGGEDSYDGSGQTSRRSQVKAVVSSVVTEILDNGNLYIEGIHKVKVKDHVTT